MASRRCGAVVSRRAVRHARRPCDRGRGRSIDGPQARWPAAFVIADRSRRDRDSVAADADHCDRDGNGYRLAGGAVAVLPPVRN